MKLRRFTDAGVAKTRAFLAAVKETNNVDSVTLDGQPFTRAALLSSPAYSEAIPALADLNPENGLCLSATYDAAFDRHLISFDEHYRLVVSKEIKDHYTDAAARSYFLDREGQTMSLPVKFLPSQLLLEKHRELMEV